LNDITNLVNDFLNMVEEKVQTGGAWKKTPVYLLTFLKSEKFLKETPYKGKQTDFLKPLARLSTGSLYRMKNIDQRS
jgi:hypothetical protein